MNNPDNNYYLNKKKIIIITKTMDKNHIIAGSIAGLFEHIIMYPFDSIKTRIQVNLLNYKNLWRGISMVSLGCIPAHALYFTSYEYTKSKLISNSNYDFLNSALCGILPCITHDLVMVPFDVIKQRMQISKNINLPILINNIFQKEGIYAFYRSFPITLVGNLPTVTSFMTINENLKFFLGNQDSYKTIIISSFTAGTISAGITTPIDVVKTKLQTQHDTNYKNISDTFIKILGKNGYQGFFKGIIPRICYIAPSSTIGWCSYEIAKKILKN